MADTVGDLRRLLEHVPDDAELMTVDTVGNLLNVKHTSFARYAKLPDERPMVIFCPMGNHYSRRTDAELVFLDPAPPEAAERRGDG